MTNRIPLPGLTESNNSNMSENQQDNYDPHSEARKAFPPNKNPFHIITDWTPEMLSLIEIEVPEPIETTNDFTRSKQRASRYWSTEVKFKYTCPTTNREFKSGIIKMSNNDVPRVDNQSYGGDYFYATCNRHIGEAIAAAAQKKNINVTTNDEKTVSNENQWWKTINKAKGRAGVLDAEGIFMPKDIHNIMVKTEAGIKVSLDVSVKLKFNTKDGSNKGPQSEFRIVFDLSRAIIRSLRNDVEPPPLETSVETAPIRRKDLASEDLLNDLAALEV